ARLARGTVQCLGQRVDSQLPGVVLAVDVNLRHPAGAALDRLSDLPDDPVAISAGGHLLAQAGGILAAATGRCQYGLGVLHIRLGEPLEQLEEPALLGSRLERLR